jgi:hypothetical protein
MARSNSTVIAMPGNVELNERNRKSSRNATGRRWLPFSERWGHGRFKTWHNACKRRLYDDLANAAEFWRADDAA